MGAFEDKICKSVIEGLGIKADNIHITSLVIGVAMLAAGGGYIFAFAVKALFAGNIAGDLFVAGQTEPRLRGLVEVFVAVATLFLQFGMSLDQGTGHHHPLKKGLCISALCQRQESKQAKEERRKRAAKKHQHRSLIEVNGKDVNDRGQYQKEK